MHGNNYDSLENIPNTTGFWDSIWRFLHVITFIYPNNPSNEDKKKVTNFFYSLKRTIPCYKCRSNYIKKMNKYPIERYLENRFWLSYWLIGIHNLVRISQGKKTFNYRYIMKLYENDYNLWFDIKYGICIKCSYYNNDLIKMFDIAIDRVNFYTN